METKKKYAQEERNHKKKIDKENKHHEKMHDKQLEEVVSKLKRKKSK
jgi:hypothetical protein